MLDQAELMQVKKYLIDILPEVLREEPSIATVIEEVLAKKFVRRDELTRLLDQLNAYRKESIQRFDSLDSTLEVHRIETGKRFGKLGTRSNDLESRLEAHRIETRERFDKVDQRFDKVEAKLDDHGARLERLEDFSLDTKRRLFKLEAGQERILRRLDQQEQWLKLMVGQLGEQKGHALEDLMAIALGYGLKNPQITPESIRLRQTLIDKEGLVFKPGFKTEVDLIAFDDSLTVFSVFEVKASLKNSDVDIFSLKIELVAAQHPDNKVHGVIIALGRRSGARERCEEYGIELLP